MVKKPVIDQPKVVIIPPVPTMDSPDYELELVNDSFTHLATSINGLTMDNSTLLNNCTNDYCIPDEEYFDMMTDYIFPSPYEWSLIVLHTIVFIVGLVGNCLVAAAVYRNHSMQTVTNYFIVNLAVADFLVILICLPPTVLWDVTETWFFGSVMCKVVLYTQTVSVSVSVLTLTFISVDRWYAICYPLRFKSTTARAKTAIIIIWILSMVIASPELVVLDTTQKRLKVRTVLFTDCQPLWDAHSQKTYQFALMGLLYVAPFLLMSIAYYQIVKVLWKDDIPGYAETKSSVGEPNGAGKKSLMAMPNASSQGQIRSRRKAAKMLIAVVALFGICYFPVHLLNVLRYWVQITNNDLTVSASLLSHWLCYANSATNPLIYNFMSGKFRKEFRRAFTCGCIRDKYRGRARAPNNTYLCRYTSTTTQMEVINLNSISSKP